MDYSALLKEYASAISEAEVSDIVAKAKADSVRNQNKDVYKLCYSAIDLTSLQETDSDRYIKEFAEKAVGFREQFADIPDVASICVYPAFVDIVGLAVEGTGIGVTSVAGGFPASQTYLEVKMLEIAMAVESGADEIDVVIGVGQFMDGEYDRMANDIELMRAEAGEETVFKVIIESGALRTPELIRKASLLSMFAGADFVKTSTGKISVAATPEAAVVMCMAIKDYFEKTGRRVGFKAAGGVRTAEDSALFYTIIEDILGPEWLMPQYFRIGASSLANNLLSAIEDREVKYY